MASTSARLSLWRLPENGKGLSRVEGDFHRGGISLARDSFLKRFASPRSSRASVRLPVSCLTNVVCMGANYGQRAKSTIGGGPDSKMRMRIRRHQGNPYGKKGLAGSALSFFARKDAFSRARGFFPRKMRLRICSLVLRGSGSNRTLCRTVSKGWSMCALGGCKQV